MRNLVKVSARLDMPGRLARAAAARLREVVGAAQESELLEIQAAIEDAQNALGKCRCDGGFKSELDDQGIPELVRSRLPARDVRSPEAWAQRMLADLAAIRERKRISVAMLAVGEGADSEPGADVREEQVRDAQRRLCVTVHAARAALEPDAYATALDTVNRKEVSESGEGSAAAARQLIGEMESAGSCGPAEGG